MLDFEDFKERYQKVPVEEYPNRVVETMLEPMVSVHVSTYQHADFIRDCMEGVLMQETDFPFEIIIGEDESSDGTREICKEYADRYPEKIRLFLHRRENNIAIHGRPTGKFQQTYSRFMCRGKYIALCQGDDYWTDPQKLQKQVDFLEKYTQCSICFTAARILSVQTESYEEKLRPEESSSLQKTYTLGEFLERALYFFLGSAVGRNDLWENIPSYFFESPVDDWPLFVRYGMEGEMGFINEVTCIYRKHKDGIWAGSSAFDKYRVQIDMRKAVKPYLPRNLRSKLNPKMYSIYLRLLDKSIDKGNGNYIRMYSRNALCLILYDEEFSVKRAIRLLYFSMYNKKIDNFVRKIIYHDWIDG